MIKKSAIFENYIIEQEDSGSILVYDTSSGSKQPINNAKGALRELSEKAGFTYDEDWNTRQFGAKLIDYLNSNVKQSVVSAPAAKLDAIPQSEAKPAPESKPEPELKVEGTDAELANAKIRVYGKAQNRTALGIMHAYLTMYPHATLEDMKKAFPDSLNPDSGVKINFVDLKEIKSVQSEDWNGFFTDEECLLHLQDGRKVAVVSMWTKPSFERLVNWAKQYGIVVAKFEAADKGGKKGGYRLEYLNGYVPPVPEEKSKSKLWVIILVLVIVVAALLGWLFMRPKQVQVVEKVVVDTVYVQQIAEIEANFNAAQFEQGKAELSQDAKFVLHDLAKVLNQNPQLRLRIEGHTSAEGNADLNMKLSEERAQAAVDFLVGYEGVDANRLEAVGCGSIKLKNADDPMSSENRRTEFIVIK